MYQDAEDLQADRLVAISRPSNGYKLFSATEKGITQGKETLSNLSGEIQNTIVEMSSTIRKLPFRELVSSIYLQYPEMRSKSKFNDDEDYEVSHELILTGVDVPPYYRDRANYLLLTSANEGRRPEPQSLAHLMSFVGEMEPCQQASMGISPAGHFTLQWNGKDSAAYLEFKCGGEVTCYASSSKKSDQQEISDFQKIADFITGMAPDAVSFA